MGWWGTTFRVPPSSWQGTLARYLAKVGTLRFDLAFTTIVDSHYPASVGPRPLRGQPCAGMSVSSDQQQGFQKTKMATLSGGCDGARASGGGLCADLNEPGLMGPGHWQQAF